ncbi:MAG: Uma2 family endonuclease [Myxococcales bacterium]|nr:Uma2 family endonuclease [Myxococcales bacterium]
MQTVSRHHHHTLVDYFRIERMSVEKHEFSGGQIYLMAGGTPRHNYIVDRVAMLMAQKLDGTPCFKLSADQRIGTPDGLYTYSDGSVFCGTMEVTDHETATNPTVLIEVLSDSTRSYDRGEKLDRYKTIPSLQHILLVEPDATDVELWNRGDDGWRRVVLVEAHDDVDLSAIGVRFSVGAMYQGIERLPT